MTDDPKPLNGADVLPEQPAPLSDLELANLRIGKMVLSVREGVARSRSLNIPAIVSDAVLMQQQIQTLIRMLTEAQVIDRDEFNRRMGEACQAVLDELAKPKIARAVGSVLHPAR